MRKKIFLIILAIICLVFLFGIQDKKQELRVRIIPSDNNESSLAIKEEVKKYTVDFLQRYYEDSFDKYIEALKNNLATFNETVKCYDAIASIEYHTFTDKTYNGNSIKDETVLTFLVKIDKASGDNWWGIIYPNFLDIESTDKVEYKSFLVEKIKEWLGD